MGTPACASTPQKLSLNESNSEDISDESDDNVNPLDNTTENNLTPYRFEPRRETGSLTSPRVEYFPSNADGDDAVPRRVGNTDWCSCLHCLPMETITESICRQEMPEIPERLLQGHECITKSEEFEAVCLTRPVLRTALVSIGDMRGDKKKGDKKDDPVNDDQDDIPYRFAGYKQYTWWIHNRLGKEVRRVIPSCALWRIRNTLPSKDNKYVAFAERKDDEDNFVVDY